jgi:hypothetical protein
VPTRSEPWRRRGRSEDSIYYDHKAPCRDPEEHRRCTGSWRGIISIGYGPDGRRIRRKVRGQTKTEVRAPVPRRAIVAVQTAGVVRPRGADSVPSVPPIRAAMSKRARTNHARTLTGPVPHR